MFAFFNFEFTHAFYLKGVLCNSSSGEVLIECVTHSFGLLADHEVAIPHFHETLELSGIVEFRTDKITVTVGRVRKYYKAARSLQRQISAGFNFKEQPNMINLV